MQEPNWPDQTQLKANVAAFLQKLEADSPLELADEEKRTLSARFLAGLTQPIFTKIKARQLNGFGSCELLRYRDIEAEVAQLV